MSSDITDDDETIDTNPQAWLRNEIEDAEMQEHSAREHGLHADAAYHITRAAEARAVLKLIEAQAAEIDGFKRDAGHGVCLVLSDFHAERGCPPYQRVPRHPVTDESLSWWKVVEQLADMASANDGDEVLVSMRTTGRRPFGDRKIRLVAPHVYEREDAHER